MCNQRGQAFLAIKANESNFSSNLLHSYLCLGLFVISSSVFPQLIPEQAEPRKYESTCVAETSIIVCKCLPLLTRDIEGVIFSQCVYYLALDQNPISGGSIKNYLVFSC